MTKSRTRTDATSTTLSERKRPGKVAAGKATALTDDQFDAVTGGTSEIVVTKQTDTASTKL